MSTINKILTITNNYIIYLDCYIINNKFMYFGNFLKAIKMIVNEKNIFLSENNILDYFHTHHEQIKIIDVYENKFEKLVVCYIQKNQWSKLIINNNGIERSYIIDDASVCIIKKDLGTFVDIGKTGNDIILRNVYENNCFTRYLIKRKEDKKYYFQYLKENKIIYFEYEINTETTIYIIDFDNINDCCDYVNFVYVLDVNKLNKCKYMINEPIKSIFPEREIYILDSGSFLFNIENKKLNIYSDNNENEYCVKSII